MYTTPAIYAVQHSHVALKNENRVYIIVRRTTDSNILCMTRYYILFKILYCMFNNIICVECVYGRSIRNVRPAKLNPIRNIRYSIVIYLIAISLLRRARIRMGIIIIIIIIRHVRNREIRERE